MKWNGSVTVITGASRGIGAAVARAAAAKGARLALLARAKDELEQVLSSSGGDGIAVACDIAERGSAEDALARVARELGPVDILVNNAGIGSYGKIQDTDVELFERIMRVNYFGTVYATKAVLPSMIERKNGHIVNIASINGRVGAPMEAAYSASKFAVAALSEALWFELRPKGVNVSLINPGPVETHFFEARGSEYARTFPKKVPAERIARAVIKAVESNKFETYIPGWLAFPPAMKAVVPPMYRMGTASNFKKELG
ncbi:MAG: SDR family NAD(P)-dependent oxidoreductase [Actinomycetota bacterium]|nr:SDR family NAD(P)-dependent oxidoreductase [Actinomycetota bacterium]